MLPCGQYFSFSFLSARLFISKLVVFWVFLFIFLPPPSTPKFFENFHVKYSLHLITLTTHVNAVSSHTIDNLPFHLKFLFLTYRLNITGTMWDHRHSLLDFFVWLILPYLLYKSVGARFKCSTISNFSDIAEHKLVLRRRKKCCMQRQLTTLL